MKLRSIHIDGFGIWHDRKWEGLSAGINIFHGPNEAGKTTLMSFVRSVLFGFERRSHPRRYEPLNGGNYGGRIDISSGGRGLRIHRRGGKHVRGEVGIQTLDPGADAGDAVLGLSEVGAEVVDPEGTLERLLGGTTRTLYHNVFAFGLEELEHFRTLEESEVASHISGAGMGVGARRWSRVWKDLEDRRSGLFLPRGQNSVLNQALKELGGVRRELDVTSEESDDYFRIVETLEQLRTGIRELEETTEALDAGIRYYRQVCEAEPHRRRREELEKQLASLEPIESFPEGGVDRLNLLFDQRRGFETELGRHRQEIADLRSMRQELSRRYLPQELIRKSRAVESLRLLLPRRDASDEVIAGVRGRREVIAFEIERIEARQLALAPPSATAMALLGLLVGTATLLLEYSGYPGARWGVAGLTVVLGVWYYTRLRATARLGSDIRTSEDRLMDADRELERAASEGRNVAGAIERLTGRSDFSHADLETESLEVRELEGVAERLRSLEQRLENEDRQSELMRTRLEEVGSSIERLFREGGASSEADFFRRADLFRKAAALKGEILRTPTVRVESPGPSATVPSADEYPDAVARRDKLVAQLKEARIEAGRLEERLATLTRSEQRSRARLREESVMARIDEASEKWAVLTLCRTLLTDTRQIYETERQPEVLRHASEFFSQMTGGQWIRVISPLDSSILVESPDGERVSPEHLSRGTAEQLYLAMRLALVREYSRHVEPLPVVLDDIFVNFDPERTRRSVEAVRELSATHQILLFTCHPHLVRMVEEIVPGVEQYPLQ